MSIPLLVKNVYGNELIYVNDELVGILGGFTSLLFHPHKKND